MRESEWKEKERRERWSRREREGGREGRRRGGGAVSYKGWGKREEEEVQSIGTYIVCTVMNFLPKNTTLKTLLTAMGEEGRRISSRDDGNHVD